MSELSYIDEEGNNVFTPQYYLNRGYCCKSNCLHCPFGTTLNNIGLEFQKVGASDLASVQKVIDEKDSSDSGLGASLLASGFGGGPKKKRITSENKDEYRYMYLKGKVCGIVHLGKHEVKDIYLFKYFDEQGITKDAVQAQYFSGDEGNL